MATRSGKQKKFSIHRLVAIVFINNDDPVHKNQVNHIDGDKLNNAYENLEWCTQSKNVQHAYDTGLCSIKGEYSHLSKPEYTDLIVGLIARLLEKHMSTFDIISGLSLVSDINNRGSIEYQKWRIYIKNLRSRKMKKDILRYYNY